MPGRHLSHHLCGVKTVTLVGQASGPLWPAAPDDNKPEPSIIVVIILIHSTSSMLHPPNPGTLGDLPEARFVYHEGIQIGCNLS